MAQIDKFPRTMEECQRIVALLHEEAKQCYIQNDALGNQELLGYYALMRAMLNFATSLQQAYFVGDSFQQAERLAVSTATDPARRLQFPGRNTALELMLAVRGMANSIHNEGHRPRQEMEVMVDEAKAWCQNRRLQLDE